MQTARSELPPLPVAVPIVGLLVVAVVRLIRVSTVAVWPVCSIPVAITAVVGAVPVIPCRYARRCALRLTPATLIGVRRRPITADALSIDNDKFPSGEKRTERGVAHRMPTKSAVAPTVVTFDIATS